jgi:hypothetical protein
MRRMYLVASPRPKFLPVAPVKVRRGSMSPAPPDASSEERALRACDRIRRSRGLTDFWKVNESCVLGPITA